MATIDFDSLTPFEYVGGDIAKPPTNKNHLRFYGHNLCPFVERAALALRAKGIAIQYVTMDLNNSAQWHKDINGGLIPLLENIDGKIYCESAHIVEFAEEFYKGKGFQLFPSDPFKKLELRIFNESANKFFGPFYGVYMTKGKNEESLQNLVNIIPTMENFIADNLQGKQFLLGNDHITYADIHCIVVFERIAGLKGSAYNFIYEKLNIEQNWPKTLAWIERVRSVPEIKDEVMKIPAFHKIIEAQFQSPDGVKVKLSPEFLR